MKGHIGQTEWVGTRDLRVGDTIAVWWPPGKDTITDIRPYTGRLECMNGGILMDFATLSVGMSAAPNDRFERAKIARVS